MFGKGAVLGVVAALMLAATGTAAGSEELTPEQRRALEQQATKLKDQGRTLYRQGKFVEATTVVEKSLAAYRKLHPEGDHPHLATSLHNLGVLREARGDLAGAETHYAEALAMRRRLYPRDHPDLAQSLNHLGALLWRRGKLAGAERHLRDALAMNRRLHPEDHPDLARSLISLGVLLQARGDLAGAETHLRDALAMYRQLYTEDHLHLATSLSNLGDLLKARGDLAGAETHLRDAVAMLRRLYPKGHRALAVGLNNLGSLLRARGDLAGAETHFTEALAMFRRVYPKDHPQLATSLSNLGTHLAQQGSLAEAEKHLRDGLAMLRRLYPRDHPDLAGGLNSLAYLLKVKGDLAGAERHFTEALAMRRRLFPTDHPDLAKSLNNLGWLLLARRDLAGAERHLRDALAMRRRLYSADHPDLAQSLINLGSLFQTRGDLAGAEPLLREALAMRQRFLLTEAGLLAEADALNFAASLGLTRDAFLTVTRGRAAGPADYDLVWQGRSTLTRLAEQRHRDLLASRAPETRRLGDRLLSARQKLAHLLLAPAAEAARHAGEVRKLTEAKEGLEKELAQKLRLELPPADATPPAPGRLATALPADACFLDFYRYTRFEFDPDVPDKQGARRTPHYVAFVLGKGRAAVRVELGEAVPLEKAWAAWHQAITRNAPADQERRAAAGLAQRVWEPLRGKLPPGVRTLYLAPDAALTQVPWGALPGKGSGTVLLEEYTFATVPHGPFLLARLDPEGPPPARGGTLLAVGGVDYHTPPAVPPPAIAALGPAALAAKRVAWRPLPGSAAEVRQVQALANARAGTTATPLTGADATTARVLAELPKARYAHLATHGFFAGPEFLSAFQADPREFDRLTVDRRGGARSPLVLSGLVFAGANRQGPEAEADRGILTAEAIVGLRLDGLELAVLSACETGLGEVGGGEGVYGLQRAFHVAGCRDVIASLWEVSDRSTAALMGLFYRNLWERRLDPLRALREAQFELYRHPGHLQDLARDGRDWTPRPLYKEIPDVAGPRAHTAQWAAFTVSGVAASPKTP